MEYNIMSTLKMLEQTAKSVLKKDNIYPPVLKLYDEPEKQID